MRIRLWKSRYADIWYVSNAAKILSPGWGCFSTWQKAIDWLEDHAFL